MESANLQHHQQQEDHQLGLSSYQNSILNAARNNTNSRDVIKQRIYNHNVDLVPISQDLGLPFTATNTSVISEESLMVHQLQHLARIKHELSVTGTYSGLPDFISSSPTSSVENFMSKNNHQRIRYNNDSNQCMLFNNLSIGCQMKNDQHMDQVPSSEEFIISYSHDASANNYRGTFSQIFPTLNISNLNEQTSIFDINLPTFDPFGSPTSNGSLNYQPSSLNAHNLGGHFKDNGPSYDVDQIDSKIAQALIVETTEPKRPANNYEATPTKKSKLQLRPSCTPLKVRKEKLGDRISALQQMVAPFGKTDTASVLMEAIGYIKFLQHQVKTLSMPYMNSTHKASKISTRVGSIIDGKNEETNRDLRSRGLCLVPISCLSYVIYGGGSIWMTP